MAHYSGKSAENHDFELREVDEYHDNAWLSASKTTPADGRDMARMGKQQELKVRQTPSTDVGELADTDCHRSATSSSLPCSASQ